jgi:triosephosphate isomerase
MDQLATLDSTYKFVDRKDKVIVEGDKPKIHDFTITSVDGSPITDDVLKQPNVFLLVAYDINHSDDGVQSQINDFVALCQKAGVEFIGLTASSPKEVDDFKHKHNSQFDYYFTDGTTLKTIIRSNPGLVLLQNGVVKGLWHHNDFPTFDEVKTTFLKGK